MATKPPVREIDWDQTIRAVKDVATAHNIPTTVFPKSSAAPAEPPPAPDLKEQGRGQQPPKPSRTSKLLAPPASPTKTFSCELPVYLIDEIHSRTFHSQPKQTVNYTVAKAFKDAGYVVKPEDLVPDRRRSRSKTAI